MREPTAYRLLDTFRATFESQPYHHRNSTLGDFIAVHLFEDLYALGKSSRLQRRIASRERVVNTKNLQHGVRARRGDGTFGEIVPKTEAVKDPRFAVGRGRVATIEIGIEVKILAKAMIKQIDRVMENLITQVSHFQRGGGHPICVGITGVNYADRTTGYEGQRAHTTDGKSHKHPFQEAPEAEARILAEVKPHYDEFLVLKYRATNVDPFPFEWVNYPTLELDYGAVLTRISRAYEQRFRNGN